MQMHLFFLMMLCSYSGCISCIIQVVCSLYVCLRVLSTVEKAEPFFFWRFTTISFFFLCTYLSKYNLADDRS